MRIFFIELCDSNPIPSGKFNQQAMHMVKNEVQPLACQTKYIHLRHVEYVIVCRTARSYTLKLFNELNIVLDNGQTVMRNDLLFCEAIRISRIENEN